MKTFGSGQTSGLPLALTSTPAVLHTAPVGLATPCIVNVHVMLSKGSRDPVTVTVGLYATGASSPTVTVVEKVSEEREILSVPFILNGGSVIKVSAVGLNAYATAEVDDQATSSGMSIQNVASGLIAAVQNSARYGVGAQGGAGQATEANGNIQITKAGVLRNLRAAPTAAIGTTASVTVTVRKNGAATALSVTFVNADGTTAKTDTDSVAVAAGDLITFEVAETADVAPAAGIHASVEYVA